MVFTSMFLVTLLFLVLTIIFFIVFIKKKTNYFKYLSLILFAFFVISMILLFYSFFLQKGGVSKPFLVKDFEKEIRSDEEAKLLIFEYIEQEFYETYYRYDFKEDLFKEKEFNDAVESFHEKNNIYYVYYAGQFILSLNKKGELFIQFIAD
jgi:energy-coupling factor transporter transmembrane protein EcfT